jgi:MSHA pilin protein MshA
MVLASNRIMGTQQFCSRRLSEFTSIKLILVIVVLGISAAIALPKFASLASSGRIVSIEGISGAMRATIMIVKNKAYESGLPIVDTNPGVGQAIYVIETEAGTSEFDWRNLCPESQAEVGDALSMLDPISLAVTQDLTANISNQYTRVGYGIQGSGPATANGCYVTYDSYGDPECTVTVVDADC